MPSGANILLAADYSIDLVNSTNMYSVVHHCHTVHHSCNNYEQHTQKRL